MSESTPASATARLEELASVTKEYAKYSRTAFGLAFVGTGAAVLASVALDLAGSVGARLAYPLLPIVWLLLLAATRAHYQRHGEVVESAQDIGALRGWTLALVYFLVCVAVFGYLADGLSGRLRGDGPLISLVFVFAFVAVPILTAEIVRGKGEMSVTISLTMAASSVAVRSSLPNGFGNGVDPLDRLLPMGWAALDAILVLAAIACIWVGSRQHVRYRALERRLDALKRGA
jgi:hypothetical protein